MDVNKSIFINRLNKIRELNGKSQPFVNKDLYKLLIKEEALVVGYENVKSNKGSTTPDTQNLSLDGWGVIRLRKLQAALKNESWAPLPARRVYVPKPGKVEKRPLGIQGPEEKVVQSVLALILGAIYEPIFSSKSFGFRQSRGAHDALKMIDQKYDGMVFAIEGDIKGMYDNINHHKLIELLRKRIDDDRLIRLIWKLLRSGYMDRENVTKPVLGTARGSIVSPCLANIYLHELDIFMEHLCTNVEQRSPNRRTSAFKLIDSETRCIKRVLEGSKPISEDKRKAYIHELSLLKKKSLKTRMYCNPSDRIVYTRYADDFIVGIAGSRQLAEATKERIGIFLREMLDLTLNLEKSKVTELRKESAFFLGHRIGINTSVKIARVRVKRRTPFSRRVTGKFVTITAPIAHIIARLCEKGFCDRKGFPTHKTAWITQEDNQIVALFNASSRGLFGFYSGVEKKHSLSRIKYIFKFSCAMTLAAKHSCSIAQIFSKHGPQLRVRYGVSGEKDISLYQPDLKNRFRVWQTGKVLPDPYRHIATRFSKTKIYDKCCICGAPSAEMHHVRHLKNSRDKKSDKGFTRRVMALINRKQIPVCVDCHHSIHAGRYDGIKLTDFVLPEVAKR